MSLQNRVIEQPVKQLARASRLLHLSAKIWFVLAVLGQWIFATYVFLFYGGAVVRGELEEWAKVLPHGIVAGDPMGNTALAIHLALAVVIIVLGPLQFVPAIQKHARKFHRLNGRMYVITMVITSLAGLYMIWTRGSVGGMLGKIYITIDALLILTFAYLVFRTAIKRALKNHRKWALRLFMAGSAVWFFRIGLMGWLVVNGGPVGFDYETFTGPFLTFLGFAQYTLPLVILELYFFAKEHTNTKVKYMMTGFLVLCIVATCIGVFSATMGMWLPRL